MVATRDELQNVIHRYPAKQRFALAAMQDMQRKFSYVPQEGLELLAEHLQCPIAQLYSMATFYRTLSLTPKGKHTVKVCDGTACHIRGAMSVLDCVTRLLGIAPGETTPDGVFSLETVNCLGACAIAPVAMIDETFYGKVTAERMAELFETYREKEAAQ